MSHKNELFGWNLIYRLIENDIETKSDILIAFFHWNFTKKGFLCLGIGDDKSYKDDEKGDELLPKDWNKSEVYTLRYVKDKIIYILKGIKTEEDLIINLLRAKELDILNLTINIDEVKELRGPIEKVLPNHRRILYSFNALIECFNEIKLEAGPSQSIPRRSEDDRSLRVRTRPDPLYGVGRADLDPLSGGGGMIYQPFGRIPQMNPQLGRIPGARFDPIGPPGIPRPGPGPRGMGGMGPDPDHLPPPGYDDMFM